MTDSSTTAILLAGGRGSRMNHQDKAWVAFAGKPLLQHVIEHIEDDVAEILISRNRQHPNYDQLPYLSIEDTLPDYQGPLAGIVSCLEAISNDRVLVLPCDVPQLPENLLPKLARQLGSCNIAVATTAGTVQPLIFMAKRTALDSISDYLETGRRSVIGWLEQSDFSEVEFGTGQFENINEITQLR